MHTRSSSDYLILGNDIIKRLNLDSRSTSFVYGSIANISVLSKNKFKQTRRLSSDFEVQSVTYKKLSIYPDLDLRIITYGDINEIQAKATQVLKDISSTILVELKIDNILYPIKDIMNRNITSFFRRVLSLNKVICLNNRYLLEELITLSHRCLTYEDNKYEYDRKKINSLVKHKLLNRNSFVLNRSEISKYLTYFDPRILRNEYRLRKVSPLVKNTDLVLWEEIIK